MATKVDELIIEIRAETAKLKRGLKDVNNQLDKTSKKSKTAVGGLKMLGGAAVLAAFAKLGSTIARVGGGFEDLQDSLNTVFGGMRQGEAAMEKVMEFAQTTPFQIEDATKAFIQLKSAGVEPSMDMMQTFADVSSVAVDQLGTFQALTRMVQRSASGALGLMELNMISDRGIDVLGILGEKLKLTKGSIAKFGSTAEGAATIVKALTEGLKEQFGGAMESKMDNLSTKTSNMTIAFKALADDVFKSGLGQFFKDLADSLSISAQAAGKLVRATSGNQTKSDLGITGTFLEQMQKINSLIAVEDAKIAAIEKRIENTILGDKFKKDKRDEIGDINQGMRRKLSEFRQGLIDESVAKLNKKSVKDLIDKDVIDLKATFEKLQQDIIPTALKIQNQIDFLNTKVKSDADAQDFLGTNPQELEAITNHLEKLKLEAEDLGETLSDVLAEAITQISMSFTKDFVDSLMAGENALDSFKDFSKQIVSTIISTFLQLKVIEPLLNTVFSAFGMPTIPKRAGGGTVQAGRPVLVGERGAEIFVPNTSGSIMNNADSMGVGGGGLVVNQSISFSTGIIPTVRAEVSRMLPQIADVTKFAVLEAAQRGGSFRKGLQGV